MYSTFNHKEHKLPITTPFEEEKENHSQHKFAGMQMIQEPGKGSRKTSSNVEETTGGRRQILNPNRRQPKQKATTKICTGETAIQLRSFKWRKQLVHQEIEKVVVTKGFERLICSYFNIISIIG